MYTYHYIYSLFTIKTTIFVIACVYQFDFSEPQTDDHENGEVQHPSDVPDTSMQPEVNSEITLLQEKLKALEHELESTKNEYSNFKAETAAKVKEAYAAATQAQIEMENEKAKLQIYKFGVERFSTDDSLIKFYTGFPTYKHFTYFFEFARPSAENMTYCYASGVLENRPSTRAIQLIDELFMFLVRIKLGLFIQDLAFRFHLHISSVSRKLTTWVNYLYFLLGSQPIWPTREQVNVCMPEEFKELYPSTRVILDCTEIFVETPSSLLLQSQLYSSYKSSTTLKSLIGISPAGAITFVSNLYTGAISDKEITRCSGILDLLKPSDTVMADKGFEIEEMLEKRQVGLNLPPFLQSRSRFSSQEVHETKTIAKLRIHVERAIRRIKEFHIFDTDISLSTLGSINQIYTIACLLTNFQGPLILKGSQKKG